MPVLPVPMIIALLLLGLFLHRLVKGETHPTLLALIAACTVQAAIFALVQHYGVTAIRPLQPVLATVIPPVAWFAFAWAAGGETRPRAVLPHAAGPLVALVLLAVNPMLLDVLIPLSFSGYGLAMLLRLRPGEDSLPHARLESGAMSLLAWRIIAVSLIASAASDLLIAYGLAHGQPGVLHWVPSLISSFSLLSLGALSLTHAMESRRESAADETPVSPEDLTRDQAIVAKLDSYMQAHKPYLDPDLTLSRLARRLVMPAKQLSAAINRVKGVNVSKHINAQRIEAACRLLADGKPVTAAMFESGFNTKSNFNREFLRVKGKSPSDWLAEHRTLTELPPPAKPG